MARKPAAKRSTLQLRIDDDISDRIDSLVRQTGANRSAVARMLLRKELGIPQADAVVAEALKNVHKVTQEAMQRLMGDMRTRLPQYLREAIDGEA